MSEKNKSLNEAKDQSSNGADQTDGTESQNSERTEHVSLDTYKKAVGALKNAQNRMKELESRVQTWEDEQRQREEKELQAKGETQKLLQLKEQQINEYKNKLNSFAEEKTRLEKTLFDAAKLQAVKERLPGQLLKPEYAMFIDTDKVIFNPETNEIDMDSVSLVADGFIREHGHLIKKEARQLPNGSAASQGRLSYDQWKALPSKERAKRLKDVEGYGSKN